jgi:hypothetical protein
MYTCEAGTKHFSDDAEVSVQIAAAGELRVFCDTCERRIDNDTITDRHIGHGSSDGRHNSGDVHASNVRKFESRHLEPTRTLHKVESVQ